MKPKHELESLIEQIRSDSSPVGMDAVYVHALILDKLVEIEQRLASLENQLPAEVEDLQAEVSRHWSSLSLCFTVIFY